MTTALQRGGKQTYYHEVPPYLRAITEAYLRDRTMKFIDWNRMENRREMSCGVPQGSVLGPLLWNLAYDVAVVE